MKNHQQIDFIINCLQNGEQRAEILQKFAKLYNTSVKTFDNRLKVAYQRIQETRSAVNNAMNEIVIEQAVEAAKNGLKSDLEIELQLLKIGFGEIDVEEVTDTPNGTTVSTRKPTPAEMRAALAEVWKKRGVYAAEKHQFEVTEPIIIEWYNNNEQSK